MTLGLQVDLGPGHIMLDWDPGPPPQRGTAPIFGHMCCGQMARWIKITLGRKVGLDRSDIVIDGTQLPLPKRDRTLQFSAHVYCGQTAAWIKMKLGTEVGLGPGHIVLDGDPAPPPPKGHSPQFSAHDCCGQVAGWIQMSLGTEVRLGPGDIVLDGGPPEMGHSPQFSAHVYCGQTTAWTRMQLGMDVGLGSGHIVLDGDSVPSPQKGGTAPNFWPMSMWPNGCMDQDATWYGGRPRPRPHCTRWGPSSSSPQKGAQPSPIFGPCLLWPNN